MDVNYKYRDEMDKIAHCPPTSLVREERVAYRFVNKRVTNDSFLPVAKINPNRLHADPDNCALFGISLYDSPKSARTNLEKIKKYSKNIRKRIGELVAVGKVCKKSGAHTRPSGSGHFTLYESADYSISEDFTLCEDLSEEAAE